MASSWSVRQVVSRILELGLVDEPAALVELGRPFGLTFYPPLGASSGG